VQGAEALAPREADAPFVRRYAFLAGCTDVICFRRYGCYANMMTGNCISFASAAGGLRPGEAAFFLTGVVCARPAASLNAAPMPVTDSCDCGALDSSRQC
jgi:hypothetical protein